MYQSVDWSGLGAELATFFSRFLGFVGLVLQGNGIYTHRPSEKREAASNREICRKK
jgi:hypothetical protein